AGCVLVPGRKQHDEGRGHDLDPAEHDEHPGVDGDGTYRDQDGGQQPYPKGQPADASRAAGPDEVRNLRYIGCPGQPGTGKTRDLRGGQHGRLHDPGAWSYPGSPRVIRPPRGAKASSWYRPVARPADVVVI